MNTIYLWPGKEQREEAFFRVFMEGMKNELEGVEIDGVNKDEPDRILHLGGRKIGVEITTVIAGDPEGKGIEDAQNKALDKARNMAKKCGMDPLEVKVRFRPKLGVININDTAKELFEFVKNKVGCIDDSRVYHFHESGLKYVDWVSVMKHTINGKVWLEDHRFLKIYSVSRKFFRIECRISLY